MWGGLRHDVVGRMVGFQLQISAVSLGANAVLSVGAALCVAATAGLRSAAKCTSVPLAGGESDDSTTPVTTPGPRKHDSVSNSGGTSNVARLGAKAATRTVHVIILVITRSWSRRAAHDLTRGEGTEGSHADATAGGAQKLGTAK
jgi:hypothetical protein